MKKIALTILLLTLTYVSANVFIPKYPSINAKCQTCGNGHLKESNQGVIFEFSKDGLQPVFDAKFFKCDHCQILSQDREFKNGYFSIPFPK